MEGVWIVTASVYVYRCTLGVRATQEEAEALRMLALEHGHLATSGPLVVSIEFRRFDETPPLHWMEELG